MNEYTIEVQTSYKWNNCYISVAFGGSQSNTGESRVIPFRYNRKRKLKERDV